MVYPHGPHRGHYPITPGTLPPHPSPPHVPHPYTGCQYPAVTSPPGSFWLQHIGHKHRSWWFRAVFMIYTSEMSENHRFMCFSVFESSHNQVTIVKTDNFNDFHVKTVNFDEFHDILMNFMTFDGFDEYLLHFRNPR